MWDGASGSLSLVSLLRTIRRRSPARFGGHYTRRHQPPFPHGGAVYRWRLRLLLGGWSILTFCRVTCASGQRAGARLIAPAEAEMSDRQREIYHSENGDRWLLCRDDDGRAFVLHKANLSSGGTATKLELGEFLGRGKAGPEHQVLARPES